MTDHADFDENASNRKFTAPYTSKHPVPTIRGYHEQQQQRKDVEHVSEHEDENRGGGGGGGGGGGTLDTLKEYVYGNGGSSGGTPEQNGTRKPYDSQNRNIPSPSPIDGSTKQKDQVHDQQSPTGGEHDVSGSKQDHRGGRANHSSSHEAATNEQDPRKKRKNMKHMKRDHEGREVTDPVTHLPVMIHDSTDKELKNVPENLPPAGSEPRTSTGSEGASKSRSQLDREQKELEAEHRGMERLFPPPNFQAAREQLADTYKQALTFGMSTAVAAFLLITLMGHLLSSTGVHSLVTTTFLLLIGLTTGGALIWGIRGWMDRRADSIWEDEIWEASKQQELQRADSPTPESTQWLNSLLSSIWPIINPDLFTSLADTLEDVMQASLPKFVRMVAVEDLGQGSEAIRILGVRWLPTGAAAMSVKVNGEIKSDSQGKNDRTVPGQGELEDDAKSDATQQSGSKEPKEDDKEEESEEQGIAEGMEAEEGDFVNVEIAFSYRASSGKGLKKKAKNAHLFLAFYLPGALRFPIWVEMNGIVGTLRMRLQLCPDPPFFSLCTLTLLGQPKASLSCIPLTKHGLNIMDLPIISSFVQSSIDAALAEYVAPKSLTLDLKDMLVGDDFKKDTSARGVLMIRIKQAKGFKQGDGNLGVLKKGSSDPYVTVGWAKYGKPLWSTRVIVDDMEPVWNETGFVLVSPEELNADERLRIHLWDSDRVSADDDLGRIEVELKELMHSSHSKGRMWERKDRFGAMDADEKMPGYLEWSVGYFTKLRIQGDQLARQTLEPGIRDMQQLKDKVSEEAEQKLREATERERSDELEQQKAQDLKTREDSLIISAPPPINYPTGILSIQVHNITGLQFEKKNKNNGEGNEGDELNEGSENLPSSYCAIILNHQKIFMTRTKPKNNKPFFNAGTERMVRDWRATDVMISVRDSRVHEDDPLIGIVYIPLSRVFHNRSQINDTFPLAGGIGYGRIRLSMVFRSIQLQAPRELLGWDYGTLEITDPITTDDLAADLQGLRLKLRSSINRGKMYSAGNDGHWTGKKDRSVYLAIRKRYSSCLVIEFRKNSIAFDKTSAFAVLWLKDIPDDEQRTVTLPVWRGHADLKRAQANCLEHPGEKVGSLKVPLKFWHGLGGYHKKLISNNPSLKDVFEVLDTASDNREVQEFMPGGGDSDSDSSDEDEHHGEAGGSRPSTGNTVSDEYDKHNQENGERGPLDQLRDYKDHHKQLHRQHRGIMQFKGARTAHWMKTKVRHGKDHILDNFKHHERDSGVETEV